MQPHEPNVRIDKTWGVQGYYRGMELLQPREVGLWSTLR